MMVNSSAKSVRSASGRFVAKRHKKRDVVRPTTTTSSSLPPSSKTEHNTSTQPPILPYLTSPINTSTKELNALTTTSIGRPPTHIHLQPNGALHQTTNGVVTEIKISDDNVAAVAEASAVAFDNAITKEITSTPKEKDKRVLRSQGGSSRSKSSLARFFPDFEDVVFGASKEPEFLTVDSTLFVIDSKSHKASNEHDGKPDSPNVSTANFPQSEPIRKADGALPIRPTHVEQTLEEWPTVDGAKFTTEIEKYAVDPLPDAVFLKVHKRSERKEKQLRNIEKEHALHEKSDLERVLAELKGPDWLRTMGVSGITETEKKVFEPHRDQYIQRVRALLNKFTAWKEQEKELKLRREEALAAKEDAEEEDADEEEQEGHYISGDLDASARQLLLEARSATRATPKLRLKLSRSLLPEPEPDRVFDSFYAKPYLRAAALSNHRRGRTITAFGLPLPDMEIEEFSLPGDFISDEIIVANARKRRRLKRESNVSEVK